jgi:ATP-dependent Lon protease
MGSTGNRKKKSFFLDDIQTTAEIEIPKDPLARVIGQEEAVEIAKICAQQRRHLLLVGPPGTGKSMIAQAMALHLAAPREEIQVVHNPENPERPFVQVLTLEEVRAEEDQWAGTEGELLEPENAPIKVAEQLGFRCTHCGVYSSSTDSRCPKCEKPKAATGINISNQPFNDLLGNIVEMTINQLGGGKGRVKTTRQVGDREEVVVYERAGEKIKLLDQEALEKRREMERISPRKVLVPLKRKNFVLATGATETELLGDVRHDPYGGHPQLGTPPYERVVAGAIHEAHEGVLFIDELPQLRHLQRNILTAMQEKIFTISGRHPQSAGASVSVKEVPCNFIFVGACNIQDLGHILSPLRSRVVGSGYEVLVSTVMKDTEKNRTSLLQFIAQEVEMDGRIPHLERHAAEVLIKEARRRAKAYDGKERSLTLRLRELGGLIRAAGDLAVLDESDLITRRHIERAVTRAKTAEQQIKDRYGSFYAGLGRDVTGAQRDTSPYNYWESHVQDDKRGYE